MGIPEVAPSQTRKSARGRVPNRRFVEEKTNNTEASHVPFDSIKSEIPVRKKSPVVESTRKRATRKRECRAVADSSQTSHGCKEIEIKPKKND